MGVWECDDLAEGTREVAAAVSAAAKSGADVLVAGGAATKAAAGAGLESTEAAPDSVRPASGGHVMFMGHSAAVKALLVGDARACAPLASISRLE
jgi:hypothetical protein